VDLEILPEPTDEERDAILKALRAEAEEKREPTRWRLSAICPAVPPDRFPRGSTSAS
jgi:hypothetical protein